MPSSFRSRAPRTCRSAWWRTAPASCRTTCAATSSGRAVAGYPISATFWQVKKLNGASVRLLVSKGSDWEEVPAYVFTPARPANPREWFVQLSSICVVAKEPLLPKTTYRIEMKAQVSDKPWEKTFTFATGSDTPAPVHPPLTQAHASEPDDDGPGDQREHERPASGRLNLASMASTWKRSINRSAGPS